MSTALEAAGLDSLGQIDPDEAVVSGVERASRPERRALVQLYRRWERQNWSADELDFAPDRADWRALDAGRRDALLWFMALFFHGEHRVTADLAPFVRAAPTHEAALFLATQVADEARHAYFFDRFFTEVLDAGDEFSARAAEAEQRLSTAFRAVFDDALGEVADDIAARPGHAPTFARGVALYHLVIESTLALPGQRALIRFCQREGVLPGFRSGFMAVARDESRHVGGGVQLLRYLRERDADCRAAVEDLVAGLLPRVAEAFQPPDADFTLTSRLGFANSDLLRFAINSLRKRLEAAGYSLPPVPPLRLPRPRGRPKLPAGEPTAVQAALRELGEELTAAMTIEALPATFDAGAARDVDLTLGFRVAGEGGGEWTVRIRDGSCTVASAIEDADAHDWIVETDASTWRRIAVGELGESNAFLLGELSVAGDLSVGLGLGRYFSATP